jgi:cytochrome c-type biogenesis protein CcmH
VKARTVAIGLALGLAAACSDEPKPVPPAPAAAAPESGSGGLRPMTSRDGAESPLASPAQTLPPGHPPGSVTLAPGLASRAGAARALFLIARNSSSQAIVAVRKEDAPRFPQPFTISGADAMVEGTAFAGPFDITARLSKSGDAIPAAGDVEGVAKGVKGGATAVTIVLDTVRQ